MSNRADDRRTPRAKVLLAGTLHHDRNATPVRIRDLSRHGALVIGDLLPCADTHVTLRCGSQAVSGWVCWLRDNLAGLSFDQTVNEQSFAKPTYHTSQFVKMPGRRDELYRRPGFRSGQLTAAERRFAEQLLMDGSVPLPIS